MPRQDMVVEDIPQPFHSAIRSDVFEKSRLQLHHQHCTAHCYVAIFFFHFTFCRTFFYLDREKMFAICWVYCCLRFRVVGKGKRVNGIGRDNVCVE